MSNNKLNDLIYEIVKIDKAIYDYNDYLASATLKGSKVVIKEKDWFENSYKEIDYLNYDEELNKVVINFLRTKISKLEKQKFLLEEKLKVVE